MKFHSWSCYTGEILVSFGKVQMIKRLSMKAALVAVLVGSVALGINVTPASASALPAYDVPQYHVPVLVVSHANVEPHTYVVKKGNTLSAIAHKFHLNWKKLYCENRHVIGRDASLILPKMKLVVKESNRRCKISDGVVVTSPVTVTTTSASVIPPAQTAPVSTSGFGSFQQCVIMAESGGNPRAYNPSSGASGLYGFLLSTWDSLGLGYPGGAYTAPVSVQNQGFAIEYARAGTAPWAPYDGC